MDAGIEGGPDQIFPGRYFHLPVMRKECHLVHLHSPIQDGEQDRSALNRKSKKTGDTGQSEGNIIVEIFGIMTRNESICLNVH